MIRSINLKEIANLDKFSYLYLKGRYNPHIIVKYRREAFLDFFTDKIRVTFDSDIQTCYADNPNDESFMTDVFLGNTIMEVKFNDKLPWWFKNAIDVFDLHRSDFSKYNHSVATLRNSYKIPISR